MPRAPSITTRNGREGHGMHCQHRAHVDVTRCRLGRRRPCLGGGRTATLLAQDGEWLPDRPQLGRRRVARRPGCTGGDGAEAPRHSRACRVGDLHDRAGQACAGPAEGRSAQARSPRRGLLYLPRPAAVERQPPDPARRPRQRPARALVADFVAARHRSRRHHTDVLGAATLGPSNIGGRLRSVLTHPTDPNLLLVGSVSGGLWRTSNGGRRGAGGRFHAQCRHRLAGARPFKPQRIYAGTGEGFFNGDAVGGYGVFVSNDGGTTWSQLAGTVPDTLTAGIPNVRLRVGQRVAVHPINPNIVLVATSGYYCNWGGLYRTTNALAATPTWTRVYDHRVLDVKFDPRTATTSWWAKGCIARRRRSALTAARSPIRRTAARRSRELRST